ncbi:hypothetical protein BSL78_22653 [Apostichopus japonicus]|uniref:RNA-directed DNA polymerase from mobile element jockey-like n=2 Tax=Stichopus japonicus TaxID=307972 RepID=A0A2G8JXM2_STIJA|nr:hypothetical protein BSL78_22653 [Apostichopus japonicus]
MLFGITESWLREDIDSAEVSHPGYVVYRQDRRDTHNGVGGGVLLYVRDDIVSVEKSQLQGSFVNSVWCELSTNNSKRSRDVITDGVVYRSPNSSDDNDVVLFDSIRKAAKGKLGTSDHDILAFDVVCKVVSSISKEKVPDFSRSDTEAIETLLKGTDWINLFSDMSASQSWICFADKLKVIMENHVPWKNRRRKSSMPHWMNKKVRCAIRQKRRMWKLFRRTKSESLLAKFKIHQLKVECLVSDAKLNFEKSIALKIKDNPKAFFSYVRSKQKVKDAIVSLRAPQADKIVTDSQDLADLLNDYFVSVFTREDTSSIPDFQGGSDRPKLDTVLFSDDVVLKELLRLNVSKASGPDAIHPYLLKTFAHYFCVPLSLIFSKFMDEGYVPRDWRCANITQFSRRVIRLSPVMHIGSSNQKFTYNLNGVELQEVSVERDLGIYIDSSLQPSKHCLEAAKRGNRVLGMIKRNFSFLKEDIVVRLYKQLVRPHLEYAVQAWNPYFAKDKEVLEKVQRRATRMISSLKRVPYYRRLQLLNLTTLELRRLRGDLIQVFKIVYGFDNLSFTDFFMFANSSCTRGHCLKLQKSHSRINIRHNFFSNRVVNEWNSLPEKVVLASSVNGFKNALDKHFKHCNRV